MLRLTCILFLILSPFLTIGQAPKTFSTDPAAFAKEIRAYMELTNKKETEKIMDRFDEIWLAQSRFSAQEQGTVIRTANNMLKKRLKPYPDFSNYILALMALESSGKKSTLFENWHTSLDEVLNLSSKRYSDYIEDVSGLFTENILYASSSVRWVGSSPDYTFEFDSVPKVRFPKMSLTCISKGDSSVIRDISGSYYPLTRVFIGEGGRIDWSRAGLDANKVYAELKQSTLTLTSSEWSSDDATFYNRDYFSQPLNGKVTDKTMAGVKPENAVYPRFTSYDLQLGIREIIKDADYLGGFSQQGSKMVGTGTREQKARLAFKRKDTLQVVISAKSFVIRPERISAEGASFTCYFKEDSIHHPSLQFRYVAADKKMTLIRSTESGISMPFFDSFHQMEIMVDQVSWKIDDPLIEFRMAASQTDLKMKLESFNLYTDERFQQIQGISDVTPLFRVREYTDKQGRYIYPPDFARYLRVSEQQARSLVIYLANKGFLSYDVEEDVATVNDKLHYYLAARNNKTDFDKIEIESVISALPNAKLNLMNFDLDLQGVGRILLSDSQQVWIAPFNQELRVLKNRDIRFSGRVHAGKSDFFGKGFQFHYDDFRIDMPSIDSLRLKATSDTEVDENGNPKLITIRNTLQNLSGALQIDSLANKSGRKNFPKYPAFISDKEAYVYYDHPSVYNGIYDRNRFYFQVDPFSIDSLDNFATGGLQFKGRLESAGIFPTIPETVVIRPDYSFGFEQDAPSSGYPMYGGKGTYHRHLDLSFKGFTGSGSIDYLSSLSESQDIVFFPDSTHLRDATWDLRKETIAGTGFPDAKGRNNFINWYALADRMFVFRESGNLDAYQGTVDIAGNLTLTPSGLGGSGIARFLESELESRNFAFRSDDYGADTSDFRLKSDYENILAIQTRNVNAKIDLVKRMGSFSSNGSGSFVSFPLNQYLCFIAQFKWYFDNREVEFGEEKTLTTQVIEGSDFLSTNPFQDSLRWNAGVARYSLGDYLIKARKVKQMLVADAVVYPNDTATIVIEKDAYMRPLTEATVVANTATRYHTITSATLQIEGRKRYGGSGLYAYTDHAGTRHAIQLDRISVDTSLQTYASGNMPDSALFQISRNIGYKGRVNLSASNPLLNFDGFARLSHPCEDKLPSGWFAFRGDIDPKGVRIPVKEPRNEFGEKLGVSLCLSSDSIGFYTTFLSPKKKNTDAEVLSAEGFLQYDETEAVYRIAREDKLKSPDGPGAMIQLNDANCVVSGEGRLNLGVRFGQFEWSTTGRFTHNTIQDSTRFDGFAGLDFMFSGDAMKAMTEVIREQPTLKASNDTRSTWTRSMRELIGTEKADKLVSELNLYGAPKRVPEELNKTLYITELNLFWDKEFQSYRSDGPIGVGFIGKEAIGRQLTGHLEIQRKRGADIFNLYLEADKSTWWYFSYTRGIMQAISSDSKFNDAISAIKPEKRVADTKGDKEPYEYMLSTDRKKAEFLRRMKGQ